MSNYRQYTIYKSVYFISLYPIFTRFIDREERFVSFYKVCIKDNLNKVKGEHSIK